MQEIARLLIYGDLHLSSKNYGAHIDYPRDSLKSLQIVTEEAEKFRATHIIGLGDFTFGRFNNLEYRAEVELELEKQFKLTSGNRYEIKGNHDTAGYGMTEYEYYLQKGYFRPAENITLGNCHITMVPYGKYLELEPNIGGENSVNFAFVHDYFKFSDTKLPDYGKAYELDNFTKWYGVDHIIGGHIHNSELFKGLMLKMINNVTYSHTVTVDYVGSMSRPAYREGFTDEIGHIVEITIYDNGEYKYDRLDIELPSLKDTFNVDAKAAEKAKKKAKEKAKENRVDISDVVHNLDAHEHSVGNPEDMIMSMEGIDEKYKLKAVELLMAGMA